MFIGDTAQEENRFMKYALVNGKQIAEEEAVIPVSDRGFRFGDGVFETILIHDGLPYLWAYHMKRLRGGLDALCISCDTDKLLPQALLLIKANMLTGGLLRIQISRGVGSRGYLPSSPVSSPTIVIQTMKRMAATEPVTLWRSRYVKISPTALPTQYKLAQGLNSTLARLEAAEQGCHDALQLSEEGHICESASANIFWLSKGTLFTPTLACGALAGITRRRLLELSPYPVSEGIYPLEELAKADAVIVTNTSGGATPVAGLLPEHYRWDSKDLAQAINRLRNSDINEDIGRLRELLA